MKLHSEHKKYDSIAKDASMGQQPALKVKQYETKLMSVVFSVIGRKRLLRNPQEDGELLHCKLKKQLRQSERITPLI